VIAPLGAGGQGEVYRARDTRLEREVAIKVLPERLSSDSSLKQRLEREAKAISKLSHPHVCALYDIGYQDGAVFLVMELVEGETLDNRLRKGPLPAEQTIRLAAQIAAGLGTAHKLGIVHRDLKPGNVMLTKNGAKLMDFGLAKHFEPAPAAAGHTEMTMEREKLTEEGTLVGTFQYMAPEQLEGREADGRTDIFALGEVMYEMATGKPAFSGNSRASLIASILSAEPPRMTELQPMTPPALERVVRKCLAKDPEERWQSASDLASELRWLLEAGSRAGEGERVPPPRRKWERVGWILAATFLGLFMTAGLAWWKASHPARSPMYFHADVPFPANDLELSPDGRTLVMVANSAQANDYVLWTYEIGSRRTNALDGTQGASYPFWSADGKSIGFFADAKLKKVDAAGGPVQVLCDAPNGRSGTWNRDGVIVFAPDALGGLWRISSWGGTPVELTKPDASRSEGSHRWPIFLPDGNHFLYLAANFSGKPGINALFVTSLDSTERRLLVATRSNAAYVEPGYLLYLRDRTLVAQPFDVRHYVLSGEPHTLSDDVLYFPQMYRGVFSAASGEILVTQTGRGAHLSQLTWFDRSGKPAGTVGQPSWYGNVKLSPDGRRIATDQPDPEGSSDLWIQDPTRETTTPLTFDPAYDVTPVWSPDGKQILFSSNRSLIYRLYLKNADGSGSEEEIASAGDSMFRALDWSHDGKYVLVQRNDALFYLTWPKRELQPLLETHGVVRGAQFSPDGRWVAYASNESGSMQVYVSPFPGMTSKWQVSSRGGEEPKWPQDGSELFYLSPDGELMAVKVTAASSFEASSPVVLFPVHRRQPVSSFDLFSYAVSGDGNRFLIATKVEDAKPAPLSVFLNWTAAIEK
jgi:Tol biopolymer transport system component